MDMWREKALRCLRIPFVMVCWVAGVLFVFSDDSTTKTTSMMVIILVLWLWWNLGDGEHVKDFLVGCVEVAREKFVSRMRTKSEYRATRQQVVDALEELSRRSVSSKGTFTAFRSWELQPGSLFVIHQMDDEAYVCTLFDELQPKPGELCPVVRQGYRRVQLIQANEGVRIDIGERPVDPRNPRVCRAPVKLSPDDLKYTLSEWHIGRDEEITVLDTLNSILKAAKLVGSFPAR